MTRRRIKPIDAYGVFCPRGRLLTSRDTHDDAEFAVRILAGTDWKDRGYKIDPVAVERRPERPATQHQDMIENE